MNHYYAYNFFPPSFSQPSPRPTSTLLAPSLTPTTCNFNGEGELPFMKKAEVSCAMNNRLLCQNTQKFCYKSFVPRSLDHLNAMYIGITYSSRFLDMAMQWMPEQVNSRVYDIYAFFRNTVNRTNPYFTGSSVKVNIDNEHASQGLTGHEKAKRGIYIIKIWNLKSLSLKLRMRSIDPISDLNKHQWD